ncbi:DUF6735 family protein [Haladaptatus sp. DYSN1]|uniref:DUF6735 family protein n=1 Tax=unclassified Haladaptatus TaxID=2622732 RepID=UPI0024050194|nr:DUF6735 family protein [Haladaptatus sp. DYSN1]
MGHRALVAYEQADGTFDLHYSQWGALGFRLAYTLAETDPFGPDETVEPTPRATGLSLDVILTDYLDFLLHEAFYVVSPGFDVTAYVPVWFGLETDDEVVGNGALVPVIWRNGTPVDVEYLEGWVDGAKTSLRAHHEQCALTPAAIQEFFAETLPEWFGNDVILASEVR